MLPKGNYGVAFFDPDEEDGYYHVSVLSAIANGSDSLPATKGKSVTSCTVSEIYKQALNIREKGYSDTGDVGELALSFANDRWAADFAWLFR